MLINKLTSPTIMLLMATQINDQQNVSKSKSAALLFKMESSCH